MLARHVGFADVSFGPTRCPLSLCEMRHFHWMVMFANQEGSSSQENNFSTKDADVDQGWVGELDKM